MKIENLQAEITAIYQEIAQIDNEAAQAIVKKLLNLFEQVAREKESQDAELQKLRDEINRLKGEQGKPDIKPNKNKDISSEDERKKAEANANANKGTGEADTDGDGKKRRKREPKLPNIKIDREVTCPLDTAGLPADVVFKGYEDVVIQDIIITTNNIKYRCEVYYLC